MLARCAFLAALAAAALVLNWFWEMAQMPAYAEMAGRTWRETAVACAWAALGDVAITLAIWVIGATAARDWDWGRRSAWNVYTAAAALGGLFAVAIEWRAMATGRWTYLPAMPVVPVVGIGWWPLLQLLLLAPTSLWLAQLSLRRRRPR